MKPNLFSKITGLFLIAAIGSSCNMMDCIDASGTTKNFNRSVGSYTKVDISGGMEVNYTVGPVSPVRVETDENLEKQFRIEERGGTLYIELKKSICEGGSATKVWISAPTLEAINASGAVDLTGEGQIKTQDIEIKLSGASKIDLDVNAANVTTKSSGATEINLRGQAGSHTMELSGMSNIHAFDFVVGKYNIRSSGASDADINALNELKVRSSGASSIKYKGKPAIDNDKSGVSKLEAVN